MGKCWIGGLGASRVIGVPYRTLDFWIRSGLLDVEQPKPRARRRFHFFDLVKAKALRQLRKGGVSMQTTRDVLDELADRYEAQDTLTKKDRLLVIGTRIWWPRTDQELVGIIKKGAGNDPLVILEMSEMETEVKRKYEELGMCIALHTSSSKDCHIEHATGVSSL